MSYVNVNELLKRVEDATVMSTAWNHKCPTISTNDLRNYIKELEQHVPSEPKTAPVPSSKSYLHSRITKELNAIYVAKNSDYGDAFGETYKKLGIISAVTRITDKVNRLQSLAAKSEEERMVKDESIIDTLLDLTNYSLMTLIEMGYEPLND